MVRMVRIDTDVTPTVLHGVDAKATLESVLADLRELIEAIDRRVPHLERKGEDLIVRDAAVLRERAAARISEIEATAPTIPSLGEAQDSLKHSKGVLDRG